MQIGIDSYVSRSVPEAIEPKIEESVELQEFSPAIPSPDNIRAAVNRIRASRTMRGCLKLMQLLEYVVNATIEGEAEYLKETTIGVSVFGRKPDYDPKVDTIVRSQAWRLRAKLRKYYANEGANDDTILSLPRGHYIPGFATRRPPCE
jgi:hypothetical protein